MADSGLAQEQITPEEQPQVDLYALAEALLAMLKQEVRNDQERLGRG